MSLAIRACFWVAGLADAVWIPAFSGMTGLESGNEERKSGMAARFQADKGARGIVRRFSGFPLSRE